MSFLVQTILMTFVIMFGGCHNGGVEAWSASSSSMWQRLDTQQPAQAWKIIFGEHGERGEYMDGYSKQSMMERCLEDYKWEQRTFSSSSLLEEESSLLASERANMMSHLYDNPQLWKYVSMVAFAEHYVLTEEEDDHTGKDDETATVVKPFDTFQRHKDSQPLEEPIFSGVVLSDWQKSYDLRHQHTIDEKLAMFQQKGIDYVRLECNFGTADDIGGADQLTNNPIFCSRFRTLAEVAKKCQIHKMVPVVLIQVPWREPGNDSYDYFEQAMKSFANALRDATVESKRVILETRPPIGVSAQEEKSLPMTTRISLGLDTGRKMFEVMDEAFQGDNTIAGFCVAGGSTKGDIPTAMEDDTQNGVRQGMRNCAQERWGYEVCFWEMGAKLMLQPKVGRLWGNTQAGRDAARELFRVNAKDMADEIKAGLPM